MGNDRIKNATSILDYIFRELAVSYLDRDDLAHVNPDSPTALSKGDNEAARAQSHAPAPVPAQSLVSRGMTRGKVKDQNLMLVSSTPAPQFNPVASMQTSTVTALRSAAALKIETSPSVLNAAELNPIPTPPAEPGPRRAPQPGPDAGLHGRPVQQLQLDADEGEWPLHGVRGLRDDDWVQLRVEQPRASDSASLNPK